MVAAQNRRNGPRGLPLLGVLLPLQRNALRFFLQAIEQYGDRVRMHVLGRQILLLSHPEDIETVLVTERDSFGRSTEIRNLQPIFGNGLLASDGALWQRQRRLIQPKFSHVAVATYASMIIECIEQQTASWQPRAPKDIHAEMMTYTREVVCRLLFGSRPSAISAPISDAVETVFGDLRTELLYLPLWRKLPLPRSRRWNRAVNTLNSTIRLMITQRRMSKVQRNDLLGMLLAERDEDGSTMSDQQVHDEVLTMFLAGHETSALALTWALYLLAKHPEIQERAAHEALLIARGRGLLPEDYEKLLYIKAIVQETMRLYPPVWSLGRSTQRDTTIRGVNAERGTHIWLCTYATQRDRRWWTEPERFNPDRWLQGPLQKRFSYLPFGAGPRMCVGQHLALMEAVLGIAALLRRFRFESVDNTGPEIAARMTLRPKHGVVLSVMER